MSQETPILRADAATLSHRLEGPVGVFVDGENLKSWAAKRIMALVDAPSDLRLCRVYGNCDHLHDWHTVPGFEIIHTGVPGNGSGDIVKNAADVKITVDAMEFALLGQGQTVILCSSDRDFTPLVWSLRKLGRTVIGVGEAKASERYTAACHRFVTVSGPGKSTAKAAKTARSGIDEKIFRLVEKLGGRDTGCPIVALNPEMRRAEAFTISSLPNPADRQWRKYLTNRPDTYRVEPKGPAARVWIINSAAR